MKQISLSERERILDLKRINRWRKVGALMHNSNVVCGTVQTDYYTSPYFLFSLANKVLCGCKESIILYFFYIWFISRIFADIFVQHYKQVLKALTVRSSIL